MGTLEMHNTFSFSTFYKTDSQHVGPQNPTNSEICIQKSSRGYPIPQKSFFRHLCYKKFYDLCYDPRSTNRDDINRGINQFTEFIEAIEHTNFKLYYTFIRCCPEGFDNFIDFMVLKYISQRMIEIGFLFDKDGKGLVSTKSKGVLLDRYCLLEEMPCLSRPVFHRWFHDNDDSDDNDDGDDGDGNVLSCSIYASSYHGTYISDYMADCNVSDF